MEEEEYDSYHDKMDYGDFTLSCISKKGGKTQGNPNGPFTTKHIRERERKIEYSLAKKNKYY
jgi:hypothetical protein